MNSDKSGWRKMKNHWNYRNSILGDGFHFLASSNWKCPYIIRINKDDTFTVYDIRKYSNMAALDFNYFGYSVVTEHKSIKQAKSKVNKLLRDEK
jgi:signal recognition particle receptor subunit beta